MPIDLPKMTFTIVSAQQVLDVSDQNVLVVGQQLSTATATAGQLYTDIDNSSEEDTLFGEGSHLAGIIKAFKKINKVSQLDALPLDDAVGTQGTGVLTFADGPATADATIYVSIVSKSLSRVKVSVTSGDTITAIAAAVVAAIQALTNYGQLLYTVANASGVLTATAKNSGTLCNNWGIEIEGEIPGVTISTTAWTGGATDPTLSGILDVLGSKRYQTILWPSAFDLDVVQTLLDSRFNTENAILDGIAVQVKSDTLSNLKTYADQNSQSVVIVGVKKITDTFFKGPATLESPDEIAAQICAIRALRFTDDALLTSYLTTSASLDQYGGMALASLPYFNTSLPNLPVANPGNDFSSEDLTELTDNGISVIGPNSAYSETIFGQFVTTYLTDSAGNPDASFHYLNNIDTASVIREYFFVNLKARYAQSRLTNGDVIDGRDMANAASIRAYCNELYKLLADEAITQKGRDAIQDFNDNLAITLDLSEGSAAITMAPLHVSQFRLATGTIQINFGG